MNERWIGVVGVPGGERDVVVEALEGLAGSRVFDHVHEVLEATRSQESEGDSAAPEGGLPADAPAGLVVLTRDVPAADALQALERAPAGGFVVAQVARAPEGTEASEEVRDEIHLRSLSLGYEEPLERFLARWDPEDATAGGLLELRHALTRVRKVRHDVNNPLTAALAEVQLLLMDVEGEEARESLEVIQEQLRRIRDRVQELAELRPPTA